MLLNNFCIYDFEILPSLFLTITVLGDHKDVLITILISVSSLILPTIFLSGFWQNAKKVGNVGSKVTITSAAGKKLYDDFVGGKNSGNNPGNNSGNNPGNNPGNNSGNSSGGSNSSGNQGGTGGNTK